MDLVYIVKYGDKNDDLKYSLRSVARFVPHDKIWIVGYKPSWVQNVGYIHVKQSENKWKNSVNNIIAACNCPDISEDFVLMNDDFFAIKPIEDLETSLNASLGLLNDTVMKYKKKTHLSPWQKAFREVKDLLSRMKIKEPYYDYEAHIPMIINKNKYLNVMNMPEVRNFMKTRKVLHKRTLYKNIDKINPKILKKDVKLSNRKDDTLDRIKICEWLSVYDNQVSNPKFSNLNTILRTAFHEPCEYETIKIKTTVEKTKDRFLF